MSDRRNRPVNKTGCKPTEDVCVEHDRPLVCRHGCDEADVHPCEAYAQHMKDDREHLMGVVLTAFGALDSVVRGRR